MKNKIFEKFQAKSLNKESQKNIVGGDWYSCVNACMNAEFSYYNENCSGEWYPQYFMYCVCQPECSADPNRTLWPLFCHEGYCLQ